MRTVLLVGLLVAVGCKKDTPSVESPRAPSSTAELDALWALAPEGAELGVVISPSGVAMIERGWGAVHALLAVAPELAQLRKALDEAVTAELGSANPSLAGVGLTHDKGFALFVAQGPERIYDPNADASLASTRHVAVFPVGDRDKFLAAFHGSKGADGDTIDGSICKPVGAHYICAQDRDLFAKLGRGKLTETLGIAGTRGDIEVAFQGAPLRVGAVAQLAPGALVVRGSVAGVPPSVTDKIGAPSKLRGDASTSAAFGVIDLAPYTADAPALPIAPKVTLADIARSISGALTFSNPAGTTDLGVRIPLKDPAPLKAFVEHCTDLPPLADAGATIVNGACRIPLPKVGIAADLWVEGNELRLGNRVATVSSPLVPSPVASALAQGEWAIALFGRGTLFNLGQSQEAQSLIRAFPAEGRGVLRAGLLFNELGVAVRRDGNAVQFFLGARTAWANPDAVVQKLLAVSLDQVLADKTGEVGRSIASAAPGSLFAEDVKSGASGAIMMLAPVGLLAGVAVPSFMDYMKRSQGADDDDEDDDDDHDAHDHPH